MYLKSLERCRLAIGSYPHFIYNASGGGGRANMAFNQSENDLFLVFSPDEFIIPPLSWRTAKLLGLPIPPGLRIEMCMDKLEGKVNKVTGDVNLRFEARFLFTIWPTLTFPNLIVKTKLITGKVNSRLHSEEGLVLQKDGHARLVGIADIPPTGNRILDIFLGLPNEALAVLECQFKKCKLDTIS